MAKTVSPTYNPQEHEEKLYYWWEEQGFFCPEIQENLGQSDPAKDPYVISMPPPNVTGALHLGHAIMDAVEDFLIRYKRMQGHPTLWVPGTDHAGIATQSVVEQQLAKSGSSRHTLGREAFVEEVWAWKDEYHARISGQQRRMGVSCDWKRERFTMDPGLSHAVRTSFVQLYQEGLIYRGTYLVNWSPQLHTAISDLEVEYEEEAGTLFTFKYLLEGSNEYIPVSTTRPETILGDTAVAVHPEDPRFRHFIGQQVRVPLMDRLVPVIGDQAVDRDFGTGALKVTPGHDHTDYEIGQRHNLPIISVLDEDACLNKEAGPFQGLTREEGRRQIWEKMQASGLTLDTQPHTVRVPRSQRSGEIVEPRISTQWFLRMREMADAAIQAVRAGHIEIVPRQFENVYFHWLDNIRDWCISRQLWWGHRIPVWYGPDSHMFCALDEQEAYAQALAHYGMDTTLTQDPDVLDTWYSSGLWPFSTLGWPEKTEDLRRFYPTSVLETGYDILFFWVAKMIMLGLKLTGDIPFRTVYLHGLVRDENGQKMSKSLGNIVDPLDLIRDFGADTLRFTLLTGTTPGNDLKLNRQRMESNRNFANKLWNAFRFLESHTADVELKLSHQPNEFATAYQLPPLAQLTLADRWILARLNQVIEEVTRLIEGWQIGEAGTQLYNFLWHEFCDWYLEAAKVYLHGSCVETKTRTVTTLVYTMEQSLRLLHPFMPFLTEAIWQELPAITQPVRSIMMSRWPCLTATAKQSLDDFLLLQQIVRAIRNVRAEHKIDPGQRLTAWLQAPQDLVLLQENENLLCTLARLDENQLRIETDIPITTKCVSANVETVTVYLPVADFLDLQAELDRLNKEIRETHARLEQSCHLMENPQFVTRAPAQVVEREQTKIRQLAQEMEQLLRRLGEVEQEVQ